VVAAPIDINSRGLEGPARPAGRRRVTRAVGIAVGMLALGACAALLVGLFENQALGSANPTAHAPLPGDLFAPPRAPKPQIVVRYLPPRNIPSTPGAGGTAPAASPTPVAHHRPSPSPSPSGRGDD
jgi:hypothetical protein